MININQTFTLQGQAPFTYLFTTDNSQVTFSNTSGTTSSNSLSTVISFPTEASIDTTSVQLTVTSACGNSTIQEVYSANPCDTFTVSPISYTTDVQDLLFTVIANAGDCGSVGYVWSFDSSKYSVITQINSAGQSTIRLRKLNDNVISSTISVTVTNSCNGCSKTRNYNLTPCIPDIEDLIFNINRDKTGVLSPTTILLPVPTNCLNQTIDWSTLAVNIPAEFTYSVNVTSNGTFITITPGNNVTGTNYTGTYTVNTTTNITSTIGGIIINVQPSGTTGNTIDIPDTLTYFDCGVSEGDIINIPITNINTQVGVTIDWSTFVVLGVPAPLGTVASGVVFLAPLPGQPSLPAIQYTVPAAFTQDVFAWTVADTNGNYTSSTVFTLSECVDPPVGVADAFTVACGSTTVLDVVANDTSADSPISRSSVVITQTPTEGTYSLNGTTGNITYVAPENFAGTDIIKYTVDNVSGITSNEVTVTITIICAGIDQSVIICE